MTTIMKIKTPEANLAVIVGRFQVDELHPGHREMSLLYNAKNCKIVPYEDVFEKFVPGDNYDEKAYEKWISS